MSTLTLEDINVSIDRTEPRIQDLRLAEALGFSNQYNIRKLISARSKTLKRFGKLVFSTVEKTPKGGRPGKEYWLNERQSLYLCTKSETPNAVDLTIEMVNVFHAVKTGQYAADREDRLARQRINKLAHWRAKAFEAELQLQALGETAPDFVTQQELKELFDNMVVSGPSQPAPPPAVLPHAAPGRLTEMQAAQIRERITSLWAESRDRRAMFDRLKTHFDVSRYREIRACQFDDAMALIDAAWTQKGGAV